MFTGLAWEAFVWLRDGDVFPAADEVLFPVLPLAALPLFLPFAPGFDKPLPAPALPEVPFPVLDEDAEPA